jgi:hypothetical protein
LATKTTIAFDKRLATLPNFLYGGIVEKVPWDFTMLDKSIKNAEAFLGLFYAPEIDAHELTKKTKLSLYILRIDGGRFDYERMHSELGNASISYVFSRSKFENIEPAKYHEYVKEAQESFRKADVNDGEGGELFLYCFLETHLNAPKILSKMELKTASNDYIKGADGIHLLNLGNGNFHLIFGESKMIGDSTEKGSSFRKAIKDSLNSIKKVEVEGIGGEISLVDSHLMKESFSDEVTGYLKKVLKPSALDTSVTKANAFGIFIGFEIDITDWDLKNMSEDEFSTKLKTEVKTAVENRYDYIEKQIDEHSLPGYHFYIYAVPFIKNKDVNIDKTRKEIIRKLQ